MSRVTAQKACPKEKRKRGRPPKAERQLTTNEAMMMVRKLLSPDIVIFACQPSEDPCVPFQVLYVHEGAKELIGAMAPQDVLNAELVQSFRDTIAALKATPAQPVKPPEQANEVDEMVAYQADIAESKRLLTEAPKVTVYLDDTLPIWWRGVYCGDYGPGVVEVPQPLVEVIDSRAKILGEVAQLANTIRPADNIQANMPTRDKYPMPRGG